MDYSNKITYDELFDFLKYIYLELNSIREILMLTMNKQQTDAYNTLIKGKMNKAREEQLKHN